METAWILNMVFHHDVDFQERISWALIQEHPWGHGKIESIGAVVAPWLGLFLMIFGGPETLAPGMGQ
jgi:hypothetical protein